MLEIRAKKVSRKVFEGNTRMVCGNAELISELQDLYKQASIMGIVRGKRLR